ncbi:hypothetical protein OAV71_05370 [Opitutales bacterium]|nr:hypothetical protein [Opitutales bacterium]
MSLRGKSGARDVAIHRVSREADGFVYSLTGSQWIATGFALAMTKWKGMEYAVDGWRTTRTLSLRGKRGAKDVAIHCMQWARMENTVRFSVHSESPRAFSPRDDLMGKDAFLIRK